MTESPLLLVDVDGVLNPLGGALPGFEVHECVVDGQTYRVQLNPGHGAALLALAADTGAELVWATTWEREANWWIGPPLGLPELPVVEVPGPALPGGGGEMFKTPHVAAYVKGRPFVWLDDHTWEPDEEYLRDHPGVGDFLLVHVSPRLGLTDADLEQARDWLKALDRRP
ncbi:HAD domain-containing protein [Microtetraspora sp. NBRC 13810]|uniref:HAD domain-containing protein n=1 Tax=Microtetraspora sp. NBRC 13810 TaxID=3030990 RepID=UPI002556C5D5|nr:HAD domain-containing protein [Microtetraspora sp. NBRC 13810]